MNTAEKLGCQDSAPPTSAPASAPSHRLALVSFAVATTIAAIYSLIGTTTPGPLLNSVSFGAVLVALGTGLLASRSAVFSEDRASKLILGLVTLSLLLGLGIRLWGIDFGFPYFFHPDEARKVRIVERMMNSGSLDPGYFLHPTLLLYGAYSFSEVLAQLGVDYGKAAYRIAVGGRLVSTVSAVASIALVYLLATRLFNRRAGVSAAFLLALAPLHVTSSRYLKEDLLFSMWGLASLLVMVIAVQKDRPRLLYVAGMLAGLSLGSKYTGILTAAMVLAAPWYASGSLKPDTRWLKHALLALLLMPIGFLLCSPYSMLNLEKFLTDFNAERRHVTRGHGGISIDPWSQLWMYHFGRSIVPGFGAIPTILGITGLGLFLGRRRKEGLLIVAMFLLYYLPAEFIKAKPMPQPERYALPCLAFLAISAGAFISGAVPKKWFIPSLIFVLTLPAVRTLALASEIYHDTRNQLVDWASANLPHKSSLLLLGEIKYLPRLPEAKFKSKVMGVESGRTRHTVERIQGANYDYLVTTSLSWDRFRLQPFADELLKARYFEYEAAFPLVKEIASPGGSYAFHNPTLRVYAVSERARNLLLQSPK